MKNLTIILDAAHGINVPGKCSPDGTHREWQWSRERVKDLKARLELLGYTVHLTVPEDAEPGLPQRVARANAIQGKNKLLISLHNNAAGMGQEWMKATGYSIYTTKGKTKSDMCAEMMLKDLRDEFPELRGRFDTTDGDLDNEAKFTVLTGSSYMAVLIEWMFQDNKLDLSIIKSTEYNRRFCACLVRSIEKLNTLFS